MKTHLLILLLLFQCLQSSVRGRNQITEVLSTIDEDPGKNFWLVKSNVWTFFTQHVIKK